MRSKRMFAVGAVIATLSLAGTACAAPSADEKGSSSDAKTSLNLGWNQPFFSYNELTSNGNATANANIKYLMNGQFWYVDAAGEIQADKSFGTYEKVSDNPLTVKYTVGDDTQWSDGTPVDASDILLNWAAQSGNLNTIASDKVKTDDATGIPKPPADQVYFDSSSIGLSLVKETPKLSDDNKSITLVYTKPFADWQYDITVNVPAHVTAEKALGITDAQQAKDDLVKAIQDKDKAKLAKISQTWNTGYDYTKMPTDKDLALSSGAYVLKDFKENEYMTLDKNPKYKGDHPAKIDTLTVRWNEDPLAQVQALENGELDMFSPQVTTDAALDVDVLDLLGRLDDVGGDLRREHVELAVLQRLDLRQRVQALENGELDMFSPQVTTDVVKAAEKVKDVDIKSGVEGTYEHMDLVMNNKGPFDPASYGGDKAKALLVRQAFLHGVPRQEVVDKLVKPSNPEAEVRNSFVKTEGTPGYDEIVAQNGSSEYSEVVPAKSQQLLKQAGVKTPIKVRMMYAKGNARRESEFQLYKPALAKAGFDLIDNGSEKWGEKLGDGTYDAVFFGWQSTTPAVSADREIFGTGGLNNLIGYSDKSVDALFDQLVLTADQAEQVKIQTEIEKKLYEAAVGITIFQFPSANISNKTRVGGLDPAILAPTMFYGYWKWKVPTAN